MTTTYLIPPSLTCSVPIAGTAQSFPIHRIYCVGRNYADHAKEMGFSEREAPFFFSKPADAALPVAMQDEGRMDYPSMTANLHHEVELVVAIGKGGRDIDVADAANHIIGYAVGLDMTRRDLQLALRDQGRPWDVAKGFDQSAPIGPIHLKSAVGEITKGRIALDVNGTTRQDGDLAQMIWSVDETIAHLSRFYALQPGDLIFTGTPAGVGVVNAGDRLHASIERLGTLTVRVVPV